MAGDILFTGGNDGVRVWNAATGKCQMVLRDHCAVMPYYTMSLALSPGADVT